MAVIVKKVTYDRRKEQVASLTDKVAQLEREREILDARINELVSKGTSLQTQIRDQETIIDTFSCENEQLRATLPAEAQRAATIERSLRANLADEVSKVHQLQQQVAELCMVNAYTQRDVTEFFKQSLGDVFPRGSFVLIRASEPLAPRGLSALSRLTFGQVVGHRPTGEVVLSFPGSDPGETVVVPYRRLVSIFRPGCQVSVAPWIVKPINGWPRGVNKSSVGEIVHFEQHFASVFFPHIQQSIAESDGLVREFHVDELQPAVRGALFEGQVVRVSKSVLENEGLRNSYADFAGKFGVVASLVDLDACHDATVTIDFGDQLSGTLASQTAQRTLQSPNTCVSPGVELSAAGRYWDVLVEHLDTPFQCRTLVCVAPDIAVVNGDPVLLDLHEVGEGVKYLRQPNQVVANEIGTVLGVEHGVVFVRFPSLPHVGVAPAALTVLQSTACLTTVRRGDAVLAIANPDLPYYVPTSTPLIVDHVDPDYIEVIFNLRSHEGGLCRWAFRRDQLIYLAQGPTSRVIPGDRVRCGADAVDAVVKSVRKETDGCVYVTVTRDDSGEPEEYPLLVVALRARPVPRPLLPMFSKVVLREGAPEHYWPAGLPRSTAATLRGLNVAGYSCIEWETSDQREFSWCRTRLLLSAESRKPQALLRSPMREVPCDSTTFTNYNLASDIGDEFVRPVDIIQAPIPAAPLGLRLQGVQPSPSARGAQSASSIPVQPPPTFTSPVVQGAVSPYGFASPITPGVRSPHE